MTRKNDEREQRQMRGEEQQQPQKNTRRVRAVCLIVEKGIRFDE